MKKPLFFNKSYRPLHHENRMNDEGDVEKGRAFYYGRSSANLRMLLQNRYEWMREFISKDDIGIEVGAGMGISKDFIPNEHYKITDLASYHWLEYHNIDAINTGFDNSQFDFIISSNMVHHVPYPALFFKEMSRILKHNGVLIIQEINLSFFMRVLLKLMKHEGYSYDVSIFDETFICTNPQDLWSANCAIPNLLFDDQKLFSENIPYFRSVKSGFDEFFCFINSGGVIAKTIYIPLPVFLIIILQKLDKVLASLFPSVFALQRQIVLRNTKME